MVSSEREMLLDALKRFRRAEKEKDTATAQFSAAKSRLDAAAVALNEAEVAMGHAARHLARSDEFNE